MKFKLIILLLGLFFTTPIVTYAQYTDEDLEYQGGNSDDEEFGPVSLIPEVVNGLISYTHGKITNTFLCDLGTVTVWIVNEKGQLYISEEINTTENKIQEIDIKALPAQKYRIICFTREGQYHSTFEIKQSLN